MSALSYLVGGLTWGLGAASVWAYAARVRDCAAVSHAKVAFLWNLLMFAFIVLASGTVMMVRLLLLSVGLPSYSMWTTPLVMAGLMLANVCFNLICALRALKGKKVVVPIVGRLLGETG